MNRRAAPHAWASVRSALENPEYLWRTIKGLAKETGLDRKQVEDLLVRYGTEVIRREGKSGQSRYASKERVEEWRQTRAGQRASQGGRGAESDQRRGCADQGAQGAQEGADESGVSSSADRSIGVILKATKLRRDLDAEQRRDYLEALLAGLSDIERTESQDGEIWYALRERDDEARSGRARPAARELRSAPGAGGRAVPRPLRPVRLAYVGRSSPRTTETAQVRSWRRSVRRRSRRAASLRSGASGRRTSWCSRMGGPGCRPTSGRTRSAMLATSTCSSCLTSAT